MNNFKDIYEECYRLLNLFFTLKISEEDKKYYLSALKNNLEMWQKLKKQKIKELAKREADAEFKKMGGRYFNGRKKHI